MRKIISVIYLLCFFSLINLLSAQVTFTAGSPTANCDDAQFCVEVSVSNFDSITSFQHVYEWDTAIMQLVSFTNLIPSGFGVDPTMDSTDVGRGPFSWFSFPFTTLADGFVIAELCFAPNNLGVGDVSFEGSNTTIRTVSGFINGVNTADIPAVYNTGTSTVQDIENPVIVCPSDTMIQSNGTNVANIAPVSVTDNCVISGVNYTMEMGGGNVGSGANDASNQFFNLGTTNVTYTATDEAGNDGTCSFDVTLTPPPPDTGALQFIPEIYFDCDAGTVSIDMLVVNFDSITGMQFGIQWDTAMVTYIGATNNLPAAASYNTANDSAILFLWFPFSGDPLTLTDSSVIFTLDFTLNGNFSSPVLSFVSFTGIPIGAGQVQNGVDVNLTPDVDFFFLPEILNIIDNIGPMTTGCPSDINVSTDPGVCNANVSWTIPTFTDNCGIDTIIVSDVPGVFPVGVDTVSYIVIDIGGNADTCSFIITVADNENPVITCPGSVTVDATFGTCANGSVNIGMATATDNCGILSITSDAPASFPVGSTTVTWTATDVNGNMSTCTQTVTINDSELPTITCPADISQCPGTTISLGTPTTSDNCGVASVTNDAPGSFPIGTTIVTWTVTDDNGNMATCAQTVTIDDTELPTISCPPNITECPGATISLGVPTVNDNCGVASVTNDAPGSYPLGTTTVTWTVTDDNGNMATCAQTVTIEDNVVPTITCPSTDAIEAPPGSCTAVYSNNLSPTVADNCDPNLTVTYTITFSGAVVGMGSDDATNETFNVGTSLLTYYVTDDAGNIDSCATVVQVNDSELPVLDCPNNMTIFVAAGTVDTMINGISLIASDNCGIASVTFGYSGALTGNGIGDDASGTFFPPGTTTVTYYATDVNGNLDSCSFDINVQEITNDLIGCQPDQVQANDMDMCSAVINGIAPTLLVPAGDIASITYTLSGGTIGAGNNDASGQVFNVGITTLEYIATDNFGNMDTCSLNITVNDTQVPTWANCPSNITESVNVMGSCTAVVSWIIPTASDNCGVDQIIASHMPGDVFPLGTTTVSYAAMDTSGNIGTCTFNVTVVDNTAPVPSCPADVVVNAAAGDCDAVATWAAVTGTDDCSTVTVSCSHNSGDTFPVGTTTVLCTLTDASGNSSTCSFDVTVVDNTAPIPQNCPADIDIAPNTVDCAAIVNWTPPTFLDCPPVNVTSTHAPGDVFPLGTTTVIYIAIDPAGNDTTCTFNINVIDDEAPVVTCPADITVNSLGKDCGAFVNWPSPTAIDNCDNNVSISQVPPPGTFFPVGTTTVTATATDDSGNTGTCTFDVTVNDVFAPEFTCPSGNIVLSVEGGIPAGTPLIINTAPNASCDGLIINYADPAATDNCSVQSITLTSGLASGSTFPIGISVIEYMAFDDSGNFSTCTFNIEVLPLDNIGVAIQPDDEVCEGTDVQLITNVTAPGATFSWSGPGFTSMDGSPIIPDVTVGNAGIYTVTVTYISGCTVVGSDELIVNPADAVIASSNSPICTDEDIELNVEIVAGAMVDSIVWSGPANFMSNLADPVITNPSLDNIGTYNVIVYYAGDCNASSSTTVSIVSLPAPEIDLECETDICLGSSCVLSGTEYVPAPEFYNWSASPSPGDGLPVNTNNNQVTITPTQPGTYIYNYSVELNGCVSEEASQLVIVHGAPDAIEDSFDITYETEQDIFVTENDEYNANIGITVGIVSSTTNGTLVNNQNGTFTYTPNSGFIGTDQFIYEICYDCGPLLCDNVVVTLTVSDDRDCVYPTVITPNHDGINDELFINCLEGGNFPNNEVIIYNIWGDEVFTAAPYQNNWEGTHDGEDLPDGTYFMIFKLDNNAELVKQYITIFR